MRSDCPSPVIMGRSSGEPRFPSPVEHFAPPSVPLARGQWTTTIRRMDAPLAILLISALTTNGLLAIGAAPSPRPWLVKTALYLACLSPLLLVPAYEPFIALTIQGYIIALGVAMLRRWRIVPPNPSSLERTGVGRFSLATLIIATTLTGVVAAIISNVPVLNADAWRSVILIGLCSGAAALTGYWLASQSFKHQWFVAVIALLVVGAAGQILAKLIPRRRS